jgi:hypothetical protein
LSTPEEPSETPAQSDEEMFLEANISGSGNLTLEEFIKYAGAQPGDYSFVTKFNE